LKVCCDSIGFEGISGLPEGWQEVKSDTTAAARNLPVLGSIREVLPGGYKLGIASNSLLSTNLTLSPEIQVSQGQIKIPGADGWAPHPETPWNREAGSNRNPGPVSEGIVRIMAGFFNIPPQ
jgi:hypothetical protein